MNNELNKKLDDQNAGVTDANKEISDASLEDVSGGAGQNIIVCPGCGKNWATTFHAWCPYCSYKPTFNW